MGEFAKWLMHDDQKELFEYLFAIVLNAGFLALIALVLWPMGRAALAWRLTKAYWIFWTAVIVVSSVLALVQRIVRMDLYSHYNAYVVSGLALSGFLQVGWSAFVAPVFQESVAGAPVWMTVILYVIGVLSCYVASVIVGAFYMGGLYKMVNLPLAIVSFIVFSVWPNAGTAIYGWFFEFFY